MPGEVALKLHVWFEPYLDSYDGVFDFVSSWRWGIWPADSTYRPISWRVPPTVAPVDAQTWRMAMDDGLEALSAVRVKMTAQPEPTC